MQVIDLIQSAESAQQVLWLLRAYVEHQRGCLAGGAALPDWWMRLPLDSLEGARRHLLGLMAIVNSASRRLDHRRCVAAREALSVFAVGVWRCNALGHRQGAEASAQARSAAASRPSSVSRPC